MAIMPYLAITGAEMRQISQFPTKIAWMACHFSPYGRGLSNLPRELRPGSLLIVDDITPIHGHDPNLISQQLLECAEAMECSGILLDFQRSGYPEAAALISHLSQALSCPVAVSELYAKDTDAAVFLSPVPPSAALKGHISLWKGRELWLELSPEGEKVTLTEDGTRTEPLPPAGFPRDGFSDEKLHCHYRITEQTDAVRFQLWRTKEDLQALLKEAEALGISHTVGLWQEWGNSWENVNDPKRSLAGVSL